MESQGLNTHFFLSQPQSHRHSQGPSHPKEAVLCSMRVSINASIYTGTLCLCDLCRAETESGALALAAVVGISMKVTV